MEPADVYALSSDMLTAVLVGSAPVMIVALVVGLVIALIQALTQVQEMTLTFVPKIAAIFGCVIAAMPFMYDTLVKLSNVIFELIRTGGGA